MSERAAAGDTYILRSLSSLLFLVFLWVGGLNAGVLWKGLTRKKAPSWIPLIGGTCGAVAVLIAPISQRHWWWLPLLLDYGSIPGIAISILCALFAKKEN